MSIGNRQLAPVQGFRSDLESRFIIPDSFRDRGIHIVAGSGSGKSLWMGILAMWDLLRGVPQVVFDPTGAMIDAILLNIAQLPKQQRQRIWPRVRYIDMSGRSNPVPRWPLQFQLPGDSRQDVADRFLETCRAIDPQLESASVQGFNALYRVGAPVGIVLASLGLQLDSALDVLDRPEAWGSRLDQAIRTYPEAQVAADFIRRQLVPMKASERMAVTQSYRAKLEPILLDVTMTEMFCASPGSVDMAQVDRRRELVLLDFRHETNPRKRLLKTRWSFDTVLAYIRHRGPGRHRPLALHFDEITELTNQSSAGNDLFSKDLDYLFNVLQRNYACWITAAHQQMWQLSEKTQETLLSLGTQAIGVISDNATADLLARRFAPLDPRRVKRHENVWMNDSDWGPYVIEKRPIDFPMNEQAFLAARAFMTLRPFEFLVKPRHSNGLRKVSVEHYVGHPWPNEHQQVLSTIRSRLRQREQRRLERVDEAQILCDTLETDDDQDKTSSTEFEPSEWDTSPSV